MRTLTDPPHDRRLARPVVRHWAFGLVLAFAALPAAAHTTGLSRSEVQASASRIVYDLQLSPHDLAVAVGVPTDFETPIPQERWSAADAKIRGYLRQGIRVSTPASPCAVAGIATDYARGPDKLGFTLTFDCPGDAGQRVLDYRLLFEIDARHAALGVLRVGQSRQRFLFDKGLHRLEFNVPDGP